jgi:tRNA(Ile)-lysidine synthase
MIPLGMKGSKKVSDLLTDAKTDRFRKENIHVLLSGDRIVWLEGIRQSDSSKITGNTSRILAVISEKS